MLPISLQIIRLTKSAKLSESEASVPARNSDNTGNDVYSGDRFCGNDGFSGPKPPDHAILFTVSGITAIGDKKFGDF